MAGDPIHDPDVKYHTFMRMPQDDLASLAVDLEEKVNLRVFVPQ